MGSVKKKVDKVMNKVADKIMPKEIAKVMPYIAMAAPFLGPVGMLATLPAQALADAKNYGKLNYKKLIKKPRLGLCQRRFSSNVSFRLRHVIWGGRAGAYGGAGRC